MPHDDLALGVDIGGTKIALALVDRKGEVLAEGRLPTQPSDGQSAVLDRIAQSITELLGQADRPVSGIGIGSPGYIDPRQGVVQQAVNLNWHNVPLRDELARRLDGKLPIWLHKDADAATIGEFYVGAAQGCPDFINIAIGTGLGMGALVNGQLIVGSGFCGMEIGHVSLHPADGRLCNCGQRGCIEMYVSGPGLLAGIEERRDEYPTSSLAALNPISTGDVLTAAEQQDPLASRVIQDAIEHLTWVVTASIGMLNPARIVLGGGLGLALADTLIPALEAEFKRRTLPITHRNLQIVSSQVQSSAVGAAALVWHYEGK